MKLLIAQACLVVALGALTAAHADVGEVVDVSKDDAHYLTRSGRAFYMSRDDDPTKGDYTATAEDKERILKQAKAIEAAQKQAAAASAPTDFATMMRDGIAAGIAEGIKAAMQAAAPAASGAKA